MKNKIRRTIIWVIIVLFILLLAWRIFELVRKDESSSRSGSGGALAVETEKVHHETVREVREFTGTVEPKYQYTITAKVSGRLDKILIQVGDHVEADEIIALLDDTEYQLALQEAEAELEDISSQKFTEEQDFERSKALFEKGYITLSEYEQAQSDMNSILAKYKLADTGYKLAQLKLEYTKLRSSKAGYIAERYFDEGNYLTVNSEVVKVVGIARVKIVSNLVEKIYSKIHPGQSATIRTDAYSDKSFSGKVSIIAPVMNEESRMAEMEIEVINENNELKPGMFCKINIILSESLNAQTVPNKAIVKINGNMGVYLVEDNKAHYIPVKTGITDGKRTEILEPEINKPVITLGQYQVKDGSSIRVN